MPAVAEQSHRDEMNAPVSPAAVSRPMVGSRLSLNRPQDSPPTSMARDIFVSTPTKSETTSDQTATPVSKPSPVARRVRESAIDQVFSDFDVSLET